MVAQCLIAVWGYDAIRSFERWDRAGHGGDHGAR